jgi:hypothetical protein
MIYLLAVITGGLMTMTPTPIARRIASRHHAAVIRRDVRVPKTRVEYSDSGRISAARLARILEPHLGLLVKLRFRASLTGEPNTLDWEALTEKANVIAGRLILHACVVETEVTSWAEVVVDEDRDARAALRVATRYMRDTSGLVAVDDDDEPVDDEGKQLP